VIRSPIDIDAFLDARRRRDGRHPEGPSTALVAGALEDRKRHVLVVERLEPLLRAGRVRLLVAGEGHGRRILEELLARRGIGDCVDLLGHVDDFAAVVARSDVLVHASTAEGVPQVVLQALAVGVPVVATQAEGLHEVAGASVTVVGRSGSDLAAAVEAVLADPPPPVSPDALDPWRPENVAAEIIALTLGLERR
jgi:glycosyltransferase involved in cell wall biosynthesis